MDKPRRACVFRAADALITAATLLLAALLIVQCASIYLSGTASENLSETGVRIRDIYSREIVGERLRAISWAFYLWLASFAAALIVRLLPGAARAAKPRPRPSLAAPRAVGAIPLSVLRAALCAAAAILIVAGVLNGGMHDVLVKAVNICTECIGLG